MPPKIEFLLPAHQVLPQCANPPLPPAGSATLFLDQSDGKLKVIKPGGTVVDLEATGGGGSSAWGGISGTLSDQTDLQSALNAKAAAGHGHGIADVAGLQAELDGKVNAPLSNAELGSGTADNTTFLRGDRTWTVPAGGGGSSALGYQEYQHVSGGSGIACYYIAGAVAGTALTTGAPSANVLRAFPFVCPARGGTIDQLAFNVTTLLSGNARIGIYANTSAGNLYPGALISGSGAIATNTTGVKTFATTQVLTGGELYWLAYVSSAAATLRCLALASLAPILGLPVAMGTAWQFGVSRAFTFNALPNPFGAGGAAITAIPIPALAYRLSA